MAMSSDTDILEYFPDLYNYGIQDFSAEHAKTRGDILRRLRIEWWPRKSQALTVDISIIGFNNTEMDESLITESQFTRAAVFHCLAYYILPKLTQFSVDGDRFERMMTYFKSRYEEEFDAVLHDGVEYDADESGTITNAEKVTQHQQRLVR
jgi:hypothetical protein